jgi:hypothetical protein
MKKIITLCSFIVLSFHSKAQIVLNNPRIPSPSYVFLTIAPDARHGAMGDAGVATPSDESDFYWNPAKTAFAEKRIGLFSAYKPWLTKLVNDMYLGYLSGFYKFDDRNAVSANITYFDQGLFQATNANGQSLGNFNSREWAVSVNYAKKLSPKFSMGVGLRYVKSSLLEGLNASILGFNNNTAQNLSADISLYHRSPDQNQVISFDYGVYLSNIGGKVSYGGVEEGFMPTNLRVGISPTIRLAAKHKIIGAFDMNKLLVPTPPEKDINRKIVRGRDIRNLSAFEGMIGSLTDAPDGFKEEMQEVTFSSGGEYWYDDTFAVRAGILLNSKEKGSASFLTFGVGARIVKTVGIDLAYMINGNPDSPLGNLWRANIGVSFGKIKTSNDKK